MGKLKESSNIDETMAILTRESISKIASILSIKFPPGSDMGQMIRGLEDLGEKPKKIILTRVYVALQVELSNITLGEIKLVLSDIITAYRKATEDITVVI